MVKDSLVTRKQAQILKELGFKEPTAYYYFPSGWKKPVNCDYPRRNDKFAYGCSMPTVDEVIDWLRRKYNIIIYDRISPFVDPTDHTHKTILFRYGVKRCDTVVLGWNGRVDLGSTDMSTNVYTLKRAAINIALKYIKHQKNVETRSTRNSKR